MQLAKSRRPDRHRNSRPGWSCPWLLAVSAVTLFVAPRPAAAFCGFYVAQADAKLYNKASQIVLAHMNDRTVVTMANDFEGDVKEFALVVPVPVVLKRSQIHVGEQAWVDQLDKFSAPRLVEYPDPDPCPDLAAAGMREMSVSAMKMIDTKSSRTAQSVRGVTIEAQYKVDEYDILILSATESGGLIDWLNQHHYRVPTAANRIVAAYLKQGLKFFVAKVDRKEFASRGLQKLRPLQIAYESPRFMLPVRLGTVNAKGPQELFVYALSPKGRIETVNYRTQLMPTGTEVPMFVKGDFDDVARAVFDRQVEKEGMRTVFVEHAWNASWCDPCAGPPVTPDVLRQLGAFWIGDDRSPRRPEGDVFVTRLHARYDRTSFPEDLVFQETANTENFQVRYVMRPPFTGECECEAGETYRKDLVTRRQQQAENLVALTGWSRAEVDRRMATGLDAAWPKVAVAPAKSWWEKIWTR